MREPPAATNRLVGQARSSAFGRAELWRTICGRPRARTSSNREAPPPTLSFPPSPRAAAALLPLPLFLLAVALESARDWNRCAKNLVRAGSLTQGGVILHADHAALVRVACSTTPHGRTSGCHIGVLATLRSGAASQLAPGRGREGCARGGLPQPARSLEGPRSNPGHAAGRTRQAPCPGTPRRQRRLQPPNRRRTERGFAWLSPWLCCRPCRALRWWGGLWPRLSAAGGAERGPVASLKHGAAAPTARSVPGCPRSSIMMQRKIATQQLEFACSSFVQMRPRVRPEWWGRQFLVPAVLLAAGQYSRGRFAGPPWGGLGRPPVTAPRELGCVCCWSARLDVARPIDLRYRYGLLRLAPPTSVAAPECGARALAAERSGAPWPSPASLPRRAPSWAPCPRHYKFFFFCFVFAGTQKGRLQRV